MNYAPMQGSAQYSMADSDYNSGGCGMGGGCGSAGYSGGYGGLDSIGSGSCGDGCETACETGGCNGGTYFSIFAGLSDMDTQNSNGFQRNLQINFDQGYAAGGAVGRRLTRAVRAELEYVYRSQTPDAINFNGNEQNNISGQQSSHAGMMNVIYDLVIGNGNIVPYIGGGVGVAGVDSQIRYGGMGSTLDGDDSGIAYQWMAGLTYRAQPNMEMFVEYRFFEIDDPKLNRFGGPPVNGAPANIILNSEYVSNDIFAGIRFNW